VFQALRGTSFRGDIALDDITVSTGTCTSGSKHITSSDTMLCLVLFAY